MQESLTNIRKHSQATQVSIRLNTTGNDVTLIVEDNGQGFDLNQQSTIGFGLRGIQERVASVDGFLKLEAEPGNGCRITVRLPLQSMPKGKRRF